MGSAETKEVKAETPAAVLATPLPVTEKPKCKACCACPETKKVRDACIIENGEENCRDLIDAHLKCMREQGFNI